MQNKETPTKSSEKKGKPALIFGAAALLFTGIMGYEAVRENNAKNALKQSERKLPIISNFAKDANPRADKVEIALLNAQNNHYSNKIIALKEEAHQNSKRLHALQISIISAEREKENQELEKLKKNLSEDRNYTAELQKNFIELQQNISLKETQITDLEQTIDALGDLVETEKKQNNQLKAHFETEMQNLQNHTAYETGSLKTAIYAFESKQEALKKELQGHLSQIDKLERELASVILAAEDKELERDSLTEELKLKKTKLATQSKNLSFMIEAEHLTAQHTQKELHYAEAELAALQQAFLENKEGATIGAINNLHAISIHEQLAIDFINHLQKKQVELKQLKIVHNSLLHDRNNLKNLIEEKNQTVALLEEKVKILAENNESLNLAFQENVRHLETALNLELEKKEKLKSKIAKFKGLIEEKNNLFTTEQNHVATLKEQIEILNNEIQIKEAGLLETKELASVKQQSNEELSNLLRIHEDKLSHLELAHQEKTNDNEKLLEDIEKYKNLIAEKESIAESNLMNFETMVAKSKELEGLLEIRENELLLTQEAFENKRISEKALAEESFIAKEVTANLEQITGVLKEQLLAKEKELEVSQTNALSLKDAKIELENYSAALDEALSLHEKEREAGLVLESKLENLHKLLNEKEEELSYAKNNADNHHEINAQLAKEIDERQEAFQQALSHYEKAKNQAVENERELQHLTELLLYREHEMSEIRHMVTESEKVNQKLNVDIKKHYEDLNLSLEQKKQAELKAEETENSLLHLVDLLKEREKELLEEKAITAEEKKQNEKLASEIDHYSTELQQALAKYNAIQQRADENDLQLNTLIEKLMSREKDLLNSLEEETVKHAGFESNLERLDQSRKSLQSELDRARANYASLLNGLSESATMPIAEMLKSHIIVPGDTLRGLSLRYYGSPNRWKEIYHANQASIKNQDQIPVGTKLTIP